MNGYHYSQLNDFHNSRYKDRGLFKREWRIVNILCQLHFPNKCSEDSLATLTRLLCTLGTLAWRVTKFNTGTSLWRRKWGERVWSHWSHVWTLTGRLSLTASTGAWKGHENWCFHSVLSTTLSRYCSWLVWRFGRDVLMTSGGGGLKEREGWDWGWGWPWLLLLLPDIGAASSPSPILAGWSAGAGAGGGWGGGGATGHHSFSLEPGAASAGRVPPIPLHSSLGSLLGDKTRPLIKNSFNLSFTTSSHTDCDVFNHRNCNHQPTSSPSPSPLRSNPSDDPDMCNYLSEVVITLLHTLGRKEPTLSSKNEHTRTSITVLSLALSVCQHVIF